MTIYLQLRNTESRLKSRCLRGTSMTTNSEVQTVGWIY